MLGAPMQTHKRTHAYTHRLSLYHLQCHWVLISHTVFTMRRFTSINTLCTYLHCYVNSLYIIFVTRTHTHTHTHTHTQLASTHTHTQNRLVPLAVTRSYFSLFLQSIHVHECTHLCTHIEDWACTTCSDFGFLFLTLFSQSVDVHACTHLHCYVNSLYIIFVTHTQTAPPKMVHMIHNPLKPYPIARLRLNLVKCSTVLVPCYIRSICARSRLDRKSTEEKKSL